MDDTQAKVTLTGEQIECLLGCRSYEQYAHMRRAFESGTCNFCSLDRTLNTVLWEGYDVLAWTVPDQFKRDELKQQFLIVPKRHVRFPWELSRAEWVEIQNVQRFLVTYAEFPGGMFFARFGDMSYNSGSVPHLHFNLWVPNKTGEVRIPVYKDPGDREENQKRMDDFAHRYDAEKAGS